MKLGRDHIKEQEVDIAIKKSIPTLGTNVTMLDSEFDKQLREFKSNTSHKERFRRCMLSDSYGVEIFMFKPNKNRSGGLLLKDQTGSLKSTSEIEKPTNIFKVIKVGVNIVNPRYSEGDLVMLPYNTVTGSIPNPQHAMYHQLEDSNYKPVLDDEIPKFIPTFVATLGNNAWLPPNEYDVENSDIRTFFVHQDLITGKYDY